MNYTARSMRIHISYVCKVSLKLFFYWRSEELFLRNPLEIVIRLENKLHCDNRWYVLKFTLKLQFPRIILLALMLLQRRLWTVSLAWFRREHFLSPWRHITVPPFARWPSLQNSFGLSLKAWMFYSEMSSNWSSKDYENSLDVTEKRNWNNNCSLKLRRFWFHLPNIQRKSRSSIFHCETLRFP